MRKIKAFFPVTLLVICAGFWACGDDDNSFSNADGIKEILNLSAQKAIDIVGKTDGYFKDELIKISLPDEIQSVLDALNISGASTSARMGIADLDLGNLSETLVESMNRVAENSADDALPIFKNAISGMSITDAAGILLGGNTAATEYMKTKTYSTLQTTYGEKINETLDKALVNGVSTNTIWDNVSTAYNAATGGTGEALPSLSEYVTEKALEGLFTKMGQQETAIRENPSAYGNNIISTILGKFNFN